MGLNGKYIGLAFWLIIVGLIVLLDQFTKSLAVSSLQLGDLVNVSSIFSWVRWHNDGAAFSLLGGLDARWFLVAISLGFSVFLIRELLKTCRTDEHMLCLAYVLVLGGALGNAIDRVFLGYVVDFILFHYREWYFPAFNVADASITVGAVFWVACGVFNVGSGSAKNGRVTDV